MSNMFQPKDEHICDNCFEMTADYGANGADGTLVYICEPCKEEGTYENVEFAEEETVETVVEQSHINLPLSVTEGEHLLETLGEILTTKVDGTLENIYDQLVLLLIEENK